MALDVMETRSKRLRTDASGTACLAFHGQHLHVFAEGSPACLAQRDPMHFHADGWKSLRGLRDGDADSQELHLSSFQSSGSGKRKRNVQPPFDGASTRHRLMCVLTFVRLAPMDKLDTDVLLRAYSDIIFCGFISSLLLRLTEVVIVRSSCDVDDGHSPYRYIRCKYEVGGQRFPYGLILLRHGLVFFSTLRLGAHNAVVMISIEYALRD